MEPAPTDLAHDRAPAPLLTVITITWNNFAGLERTQRSLQCQTSQAFEWIVVDGGSSDRTPEALKTWSNVAQWRSEPDRGIADAFNKGIALANGTWLLFLNAGDRLASDHVVAEVLEFLGQDGRAEADVVYGMIALERDGLITRQIGSPVSWPELARRMRILHQAAFFNRAFLAEIGPYREDYRIAMDYELLLRKGPALKMRWMPLVVSVMEYGGVSNSKPFRGAREQLTAQKEHRALSAAGLAINAAYLYSRCLAKPLANFAWALRARLKATRLTDD